MQNENTNVPWLIASMHEVFHLYVISMFAVIVLLRYLILFRCHNRTCHLQQSPMYFFPALLQSDRMRTGHVTGSAAFSAENELG